MTAIQDMGMFRNPFDKSYTASGRSKLAPLKSGAFSSTCNTCLGYPPDKTDNYPDIMSCFSKPDKGSRERCIADVAEKLSDVDPSSKSCISCMTNCEDYPSPIKSAIRSNCGLFKTASDNSDVARTFAKPLATVIRDAVPCMMNMCTSSDIPEKDRMSKSDISSYKKNIQVLFDALGGHLSGGSFIANFKNNWKSYLAISGGVGLLMLLIGLLFGILLSGK